MSLITTINFRGRTEEALDFYRSSLAAEIVFLMRFRDRPTHSGLVPGSENLIFHATFRIEGTELMASDIGYGEGDSSDPFSGFALLLRLDSADRARSIFDALAEGGEVLIPLDDSDFTTLYGIVMDRFGIFWKISIG